MLSREQQHLLRAAGSRMAADALLDRLRDGGSLLGGGSGPHPGAWIGYNRQAVWLEEHTDPHHARSADGTDEDSRSQMRSKVTVKVTWAQAAAHGAAMPPPLRAELAGLQRTEREENRTWTEFSAQRGGWPWRSRFETDEEHQAAQAEWDGAYERHATALRGLTARRATALDRALPLTVDAEPEDLLDLLEQIAPPETASTTTGPESTLQAGALRRAPSPAPGSQIPADEALFRLPTNAPRIRP